MKNLILFLLLALPASAQVTKTIKHRGLDQDLQLCVNDGGTSNCSVTVDGPTGNVGINTAVPDAVMHVMGTDTGTAPEAGVTHQLFLEDNAPANLALSFMGNTTQNQWIFFGDTTNADDGYVRYDQASQKMTFGTNGSEKLSIHPSVGIEMKPHGNSVKKIVGGSYPGTIAPRDILTVATNNTSGFVRMRFTTSRNVSSLQGARSHEILTYWYLTSKGSVVTQLTIESGASTADPTVAWSGNTLTLAQASANGGGEFILEIEVAWRGGTAPTFDI